MEVTKIQTGHVVELVIAGRLDGYWAEHLTQHIDQVVRGGAHHIRLNLASVDYISSAGIRVLLQFYKKLKAIDGSLALDPVSEPVTKILALAGLADLFQTASAAAATAQASGAAAAARGLESAHGVYDVIELAPNASLTVRTMGDPTRLDGVRFTEADVEGLFLPPRAIALGIGALGSTFADCQPRFGEFLAASGAAVYQPTDGTNVPDYLVTTGTLVPELQVCYGLLCDGTFGTLLRFDAKPDVVGVPLSELIDTTLSVAKASTVGFAIAAETAGLVGAALRRSPATGAAHTAPFSHPGIREWLTFTAERAFPNSVVLAVGVATTDPPATLKPFVRPTRTGGKSFGHVHAAAFSYRPLPRGRLELESTVASLFEHQSLQGLLHLIADDWHIEGAGESELIRGACWLAAARPA
jgi:anti-anti-sigma factor